jgi:hypothetical protein
MARDTAASGEYVQELKERYDTLKGATERVNAESAWQEIGELVSPRKIDFVGSRTPGEKRMSKVYDPTGIHANDLLAAGLHGMATNPASKWFSLRMVAGRQIDEAGELIDLNDDPAVQKYLSHVEDVMWQRIYQPGTNFTTAVHETYLDLGSFGTSILFVGQRDNGGLLFESRPLSECVMAENADGKVDTVFRKTEYTVRQMLQMKRRDGWDVSDEVQKMYDDKKYDETVCVIHAVYPNEEREYGKRDRKNMAYASCYFEHETGKKLEDGGFPEFPYLAARWSKYAGEIYGRSPAMTALPDIKMLQAMTLTVLKAAQKIVDPPLWLKSDGVVGQTRTVPGGINYWKGNPNDGVMLMPVTGQALPITLEMLEAVRNRIRTTFFVDILQIVTDQDMTATEVMQRTAERMRLMGPLVGRLEAELLGPMVERVFGILGRLDLLPPAPEIIQDKEFTVEYVSPIATAQKQQAASGIMQAFQIIGMLGPDAVAQVAMKNMDINKTFRWAWDLFNNDPDLLKDNEAVAQAEQMEAMQRSSALAQPMVGMAAQGGKGIKDLAGAVKALGDTQAGGGIDLKRLIGSVGQELQDNPDAQALAQGAMNGELTGAP